MKKIISVFLLICAACMLFSCGERAPEERKMTVGKRNIVYNGTVYFNDSMTPTVRYHIINNVQPEGLRLIGDALEYGKDDPFFGSRSSMIAVSEYETKKNDGYPVLCISSTDFEDTHMHNLVLFNTKTNSIKMLHKGSNTIASLYVYGEYIFFNTADGRDGYNIHSIKSDGSGYKKLDNPENRTFRIKGCYNNELYYSPGATIYKTSLDLEGSEAVFDNFYAFLFFYDNYAYYVEYGTRKLVRRKLSDPSTVETVIDEEVYAGVACGDKFIYRPGSIEDGQVVFIYYVLDLNTFESTKIMKVTTPYRPVWSTYDFDGKHILLGTTRVDDVNELCTIDIETKEVTYMKQF